MMMMMGIGGLVLVGGVIVFWDKICPALNMCDVGKKPEEAEEEGEEEMMDTKELDCAMHPGYGACQEEGRADAVTYGCCNCQLFNGRPRCQQYGAGPWISYKSAMNERSPEKRLKHSMSICNKRCPTQDRARGKPRLSKANFSMGTDVFFAGKNGRMSL